jgi:hypothetical protein
MSITAPLFEDYPDLARAVDRQGLDAWDFFAVCGAIYCGLRALADVVEPERALDLSVIPFDPEHRHPSWERPAAPGAPTEDSRSHLYELREAVFRDGPKAVSDCAHYARGYAEQIRVGDPIAVGVGIWVLWQIIKERPDGPLGEAAHAVGAALKSSFLTWWDD